MQAWQVWIIVGIVLSILEIFTAGFLIINFGLGAIITGLLALTGIGVRTQILVFAVSSLILFTFSRKFAIKYLTKDKPEARTNIHALEGKIGIVTAAIGGTLNRGQVKVGGEEWSAVCDTEIELPVGEKVIIAGVDGNKLIVKKTG
jgi:membrane protein implicated in regulation of membrane protease activity